MKKIRWLLEAAIIIILILPFAVMPVKVSRKAGESFGFLVFRLWKKRREIAIENIINAVQSGDLKISESPEMLARKCFGNLGISLAEIAMIYFGTAKEMVERVRIEGIEHYGKAKFRNKGILLITGHCGNWELLAVAFNLKVDKISVVARGQNNPYFNKLVEKIRTKYGNNVIYKKGAIKGILSELKENRTVGILIDQAVLTEEGVAIEFMGRRAWAMKTPALIARKTGCSVLPAFISRDEEGGFIITIKPEVSLSTLNDQGSALLEDVRVFSGFIEDYIRQHPSEWLWIHRRWKRA